MANGDKTEHGIFIATGLTALFAAIGAMKSTAKAAGLQVVSFTQEIMDLLTAMALGVGSIIELLQQIRDLIGQQGSGGTGSGYPDNADSIISRFVNCPLALPNAVTLPDIPIPKGMKVVLLARTGMNAAINTGIIWVTNNEQNAAQPLLSYPLTPGATISYAVKNAEALSISSTVAGEGVFITVESGV